MKVLGISASGRKKGNSNLLLGLALQGAAEQGAQVEKINLTDYSLLSCTGCMKCILQEQPCHLQDDMPQLLEKLQAAQGVILAAPTYVLSPAAATKLMLDRFLMIGRQVKGGGYKGTAATITTAGLPQLNSLGELINLLPLAYQLQLVDYLVAYGPGPGEPLLEEGVEERAKAIGARVVQAWQGKASKRPPEKNQCPHCYGTTFKLGLARQVECALCGAKAKAGCQDQWELEFDLNWEQENRFAPDRLKEHVFNWIIGSRERYMSKLPEIMAKGIFSGKTG